MAKKRRRKKRPPAPAPPEPAAVAADDARRATQKRRAGSDEAPPPPWGSFPLSEIVILIALVSLFAGFFVSPPRGPILIGTGLALGSLAGLEVSFREHLAGYRSHTLLISGLAAIAVVAAIYFTVPDGTTVFAALIPGVIAFGLAAWWLTRAFRRRSGGASFKFR